MNFAFALNAILSLGLISNLYPPELAADVNRLLAPETQTAEVREIILPSPVMDIREVWLTAYSSTPEETDDTPFITALGTATRDGIVATNFLPFGTRVKIPEVFGDKIFVVEDRMHPRKTDFLDVWMPSKQDALKIGIRRATILVLAPEMDYGFEKKAQ